MQKQCIVCGNNCELDICNLCGFRNRVLPSKEGIAADTYAKEVNLAKKRWEERKADKQRIAELERRLAHSGDSPSSKSCPEGHGPLEDWEGEMRCWTCGWTPAKCEANTSDTTKNTEEEVEAVKKRAPRARKLKNPCYCCFNREKRKNLHIKLTIRDGNLTMQTPISIPLCQVCLNNAPASEMTDGVRRRLAETSEDSVVMVNGRRIDRTKEISDQAILPTLSNALSKERSKKKSQ